MWILWHKPPKQRDKEIKVSSLPGSLCLVCIVPFTLRLLFALTGATELFFFFFWHIYPDDLSWVGRSLSQQRKWTCWGQKAPWPASAWLPQETKQWRERWPQGGSGGFPATSFKHLRQGHGPQTPGAENLQWTHPLPPQTSGPST